MNQNPSDLPALSVIAAAGELWRKDIPLFREAAWISGDTDLSDAEVGVLDGVVLRVGA